MLHLAKTYTPSRNFQNLAKGGANRSSGGLERQAAALAGTTETATLRRSALWVEARSQAAGARVLGPTVLGPTVLGPTVLGPKVRGPWALILMLACRLRPPKSIRSATSPPLPSAVIAAMVSLTCRRVGVGWGRRRVHGLQTPSRLAMCPALVAPLARAVGRALLSASRPRGTDLDDQSAECGSAFASSPSRQVSLVQASRCWGSARSQPGLCRTRRPWRAIRSAVCRKRLGHRLQPRSADNV